MSAFPSSPWGTMTVQTHPSGGERESSTDSPDAKPCGWKGEGNETGTPWKTMEEKAEES